MKKTANSVVHYVKTIHLERLLPLPKSWQDAAGMAKEKKVALEKHARKIRNEWGKK